MKLINKIQYKHNQEIILNDYYIDKNGVVYNKKYDNYYPLKPFTDGRRGYLKVRLYGYNSCNQSIHVDRYIHRLMMETFYPENINENVDHIDRDITNNTLSNLRWANKKDNTKSLSTSISLLDIQKIYELFYLCHKTLSEIYNYFEGKYDKERLTNIIKGIRYKDEFKVWMEMYEEVNVYSETQIYNVLKMYYHDKLAYNIIMYETGINKIDIIKICMGSIYRDIYIKFMKNSNEFND